ncbi:PhzF family phenazine biosynthesis protein [Buttiauxella gaviniae ATCC 51604]|uniref:PhzF family phenazine biosynthesis protein n=1 Tax=Buttiauxella gaviniae ATCC 51604 TaxID=1354253 RepID=A0A1B7HNG3_9ENTR|nr:PhzF family phenazine biosynthesis protein [Buttiauxella gaviniae ATCC 51604]
MQQIDFYMVDAFSDTTFGGNAAAVCPLTEWLPDETLLAMSRQHNQSETAFFITTDSGYELRWFTTQGEINLCGHATLAAAHVIFEYLNHPETTIHFDTRFVGPLSVTRNGDWLTLDFPAWESEPVMPLPLLLETLGITQCQEVRVARDYMVVLENQQQVEAVCPNINAMIPLEKMVCITAPGDGEYDFVSRFSAQVNRYRKIRLQGQHIACSSHIGRTAWVKRRCSLARFPNVVVICAVNSLATECL